MKKIIPAPKSEEMPPLVQNWPVVIVDFARSFVGVKESGGNNKGSQIEEFQKAVDGVASGEPWCMAFVQFVLKCKLGKLNKLKRSESCLEVWRKTPMAQRLKKPESGCLIVWQFGDTDSGHVEIIDDVFDDGSFTTVGGNTSDGSGISREGDGVYHRVRSVHGTSKMRVLGFLQPW